MYPNSKRIYILIGPSGIGKTTIGRRLGKRIGLPFYDADDFHSVHNIEKMRRGIPLTDQDRLPWLDTLAEGIKKWYAADGAVLACSALKEKYRKRLMSVPDESITWIYLYGDKRLIGTRLSARKAHFFNKELLQAQLNDLEVPDYGLHINIDQTPQQIVDEILTSLKERDKHGN